ncbi:hypothetical protein [Thermoanaerobacterium sp. RBIITD]|uniref:hypothetical protein n=1 Tax=Thermoanaerobacterium sp. RBIITD TaxID=1550240 RepID=UPI000BB6A003|nr:hypothetical protein [Thermoanaerobacterium sp. RBIITD]SNX54306.1 hypothetical protein SAMN05660242_1962 [Thermoanaerobacterium sp. RBIITD]
MLKVLGVTVVFIVISLIEVPGLLKQKKTKEVVVFFILIAIGYTLNLLVVFNVAITPANKFIEMLFKPIENIWGK